MQRFFRLSGQGACRSTAFVALALVAAWVLSLLVATPGLAAPLQQGVIYPVRVSDVRDVQFTVSWTTRDPSNGQVEWGTSTSLGNTTSDPVTNSTTHYVNITTGVLPNTTYYFQVRSGGLVDNNGGAFYTVTTGPTLGIPSPQTVYGYVYQFGGTAVAANTIIYLRIRDVDGLGSLGYSQLASARTNGAGVWSFVLSNVRTTTGAAFFSFTPNADNLEIAAQGGISGTASLVVVVPQSVPAQLPNMTLSGTPTAVRLAEFTADSAAMIPILPAVALVTLGVIGLVVWLRSRQRRTAWVGQQND